MPHKTEFYLFKRKMKKGFNWYVCFLDPITGKQMTAKSIDVINEKLKGRAIFERVHKRDEAVIIAHHAIKEGIIFKELKQEIPFTDYLESFWNYDSSDYIRMRNRYKKNSIGRDYAANMLYNIKVNVIPYLPENLTLERVNTRHLEKVQDMLFQKGLASSSINAISYSWSIPLKEAKREGLIKDNPAINVLRIYKEEKKRDYLKEEEIINFCKTLHLEKEKMKAPYYYALVLASSTGMRLSEIRALNTADILPSSYIGYEKVIIRHSVSSFSGLKDTKGKYERAILIPKQLADKLKSISKKDGRIFPSELKPSGYISSPTLRNEFYRILEKSGLSEEERRNRNITFHSLRHTFSTLGMDNNISKEDRMLVLGHKSEEVNNRYTHVTDEALKRVSKFTDNILSLLRSSIREDETT